MDKLIMETKINYTYIDSSKEITIVLLHGWGQNIEMMEPFENVFKENYNILNIDLPGFGESKEPPYDWSIYDYERSVYELIKELKLKKVILIGHSFGGRIALIYASKHKVEKLVCLASPYCKEITKLSFKTKLYKKVKKVKHLNWLKKIMEKKLGSEDYKNASKIMKKVLVKTVNQDLDKDVKKIKCPTLLIWGTNDEAVPIKRAYELENMIKDAAVIKYEGASHYAYLERFGEIIKVLKAFF